MTVGFHLPLSWFSFLSNQIPINYLFTIIPKDYSNIIKEDLLSLKKRKKRRLDNQPKFAIKQEDQFEKLEFKKSWQL